MNLAGKSRVKQVKNSRHLNSYFIWIAIFLMMIIGLTMFRNSEEDYTRNAFVADMEDGSHFYTSVGGSTIYGTEDDIDSGTDIIELHDFYSYDVSGFIWDESAFCIIVEVIAKRLEDGK